MHPTTPETTGHTVRYGIVAILGALIFPPVGVVYAVRSYREPKHSRAVRTFSVVAAVIVAVSVITYSLLFAGGVLPFTKWVISH